MQKNTEKVMNSIKWDGYERLFRLAYKMMTNFNTGDKKGYRIIGTPITT